MMDHRFTGILGTSFDTHHYLPLFSRASNVW